MYKNATKCNKTQSKWCENKHGASKIIDTFEMYQQRIEEKFCKLMLRVATSVTHSYRSLHGWWDAIKASCSRWCGALEEVQNAPPSGVGIDDYVSIL
jgi:hypothetical protein